MQVEQSNLIDSYGALHNIEAMSTLPVWSGARKILAVDCDLTDLKAHMLPQLLAFFPLRLSLKNFTLDEIFTSQRFTNMVLHWVNKGSNYY